MSTNATNVTASGAYLTGGQDASGGYWTEFHISASSLNKGGSAAAEGVLNGVFYYTLDAVNQYVYGTTDIHDDWDGDSDLLVEVVVALAGAETANDYIRASLLTDYFGEHDDINSPKTQTISIDHDIGNFNATGSVHELFFRINFDEGGNVIEKNDVFCFRFWLDDVTSGATVASVRVLYINIKYLTKYPALSVTAALQASG